MKSAPLIFAAVVLLGGCSRESGTGPQGMGNQTRKADPESPAALVDQGVADPDPSRSPPSAPFFVGRWASDAANCRKAAWIITEEGLETPGEVTCQFHRVTPTARGYEAESTCTAEGPPEQWKIQFSFAESAQALLIENAPFADIGLVRCEDSAH